MANGQIPFDFTAKKQRKPARPKKLPKPEPQPRRPGFLKRCWRTLLDWVLRPVVGWLRRSFIKATTEFGAWIILAVTSAALGIGGYQADVFRLRAKPELRKIEPPKQELSKVGAPKLEPSRRDGPKQGSETVEKNDPWEAVVREN